MTVRRVVTADGAVEVTGVGYEPTREILMDGLSTSVPSSFREVLRGGVLASDARLVSAQGRWRIEGDPTEGALVVAAAKAALDQTELNHHQPRVHEIPFSSERRRMTTLHTGEGTTTAYSKGSADFKAYNYRSDRLSVLRRPFANRWLNMAIAWELALLAVVIYLPFLQEPFGTFSFGWTDWALPAALASTIVPVLESVKWMERRGYFGELR